MTAHWGHPVSYVACVLAAFAVAFVLGLLGRGQVPPPEPRSVVDQQLLDELRRLTDVLERMTRERAATAQVEESSRSTEPPAAEDSDLPRELVAGTGPDEGLIRAVLYELRGIRESIDRGIRSTLTEEMPASMNVRAVQAVVDSWESDEEELRRGLLMTSARAAVQRFGRPSKISRVAGQWLWEYVTDTEDVLRVWTADGVVANVDVKTR